MEVNLSPDDKATVELVTERWNRAEERHVRHRAQWRHLYALYNNYNDWQKQSRQPKDRDFNVNQARDDWGHDLFIPYGFWTVETTLPRMLSNRPRMLVLPRNSRSEENVENMKFLIDSQQEEIQYELVLQDIAKEGLIYGLGVEKVYWCVEKHDVPKLVRSADPKVHGYQHVEDLVAQELFNGPVAECIDIWNFRWDPTATDLNRRRGYNAACGYVFHRTFRTHDYVMKMLGDGGPWLWPGDLRGDMDEQVKSLTSAQRYTEAHQDRDSIDRITDRRGDGLHEVWEYHDGTRVITLLDRAIPVQQGANPMPTGDLPFHVYRPTRVPHSLVGKGEIEPIEDLIGEMNTMRTNRQWNALLKLQTAFFFTDGMIDPDNFKVGPGTGIPVNGDPNELVKQINFGDIPNSGYQDVAELKADMEMTSGLNDNLAGNGTSSTATEAQLQDASASLRIQNKTRLLEAGVIGPTCAQFGAMNQLKIMQKEIRQPIPPTPDNPNARWQWVVLTPDELAGEFAYVPEGGSTAPANVQQDRNDAMLATQLFGQNQNIDQRAILKWQLKKMGVENPDSMLAPEQPQVPTQVLENAVAKGADPNAIADAIDEHAGPPPEQQAA